MKKLLTIIFSITILILFTSCVDKEFGNADSNQSVDTNGHDLVTSDYVVEDGKLYKVEECTDEDCNYSEKTFVTSSFNTATPENVNTVINSVNNGYIYLSPGTYSEAIVFSHSKDVTEVYQNVSGNYEKVNDDELSNSQVYYYFRTIEDMNIVASKDAIIDGVNISLMSGHCYGTTGSPLKDPMRPTNNTESTVGSYYSQMSVKNISFDNLTLENNGVVDLEFYQPETSVDGLTISNSTFTGKVLTSGNAAIHAIADSEGVYSNFIFENISVDGAFQGILVQGVDNVLVSSCNITNTHHNAVAIQNGASSTFSGTIDIKENTISNGLDRAIRFGTGDSATITISNNTFSNTGDSDGELIKSQTLTNCTYTFENNTYDGALLENTSGSGNILISR